MDLYWPRSYFTYRIGTYKDRNQKEAMSKIKTLHLVYNGFNEYEVALTCSLLTQCSEHKTVGLDYSPVQGEGGLRVIPDLIISEVDPQDYDLLLISGMLDGEPYWQKTELFDFISRMDAGSKLLAAICGGPLFLAKAGALEGKNYTCSIPYEGRQEAGVFERAFYRDEDLVVDKNIITAKGYATLDFALSVADRLKLFKSPEDRRAFRIFWSSSSEAGVDPERDSRLPFPLLSSDRAECRIPERDDADAILDFYLENLEHLAPWDPKRPDEFYTRPYWEEVIERSRRGFQKGESLRLCIFPKDEQRVIGVANFTNFEYGPFRNCRLGYAISRNCEGKGLMSEALKTGLEYIFTNLGMHRVEANFIPENHRSAKMLRRLGFSENGIARNYLKINGRWQDHILSSITAEQWQSAGNLV